MDVGLCWSFESTGLVSLYTQHNMVPGNSQGELLPLGLIQLVQLSCCYGDSNVVMTVNQSAPEWTYPE